MTKWIYLLLLCSSSALAIPDWAKKNTFTKINGHLLVVCSGQGPSIDLAREQAISSCQASVSRHLQENINVKSLSVETETNVGFHQEVTSEGSLKNISCIPKNEEIESTDSSHTVWLKCSFDLTKIKTSTNSQVAKPKNPNLISKDIFQVTLSTVPKCDSVIIRGKRSRTEPCRSNPLKLNIYSGDTEIIIRASGHKPLTMPPDRLLGKEPHQFTLEPL